MVPWTWTAPSTTAASEFATAVSLSLCAWMPSGVFTSARTARNVSPICHGIEPGLDVRVVLRPAAHAAGGAEGGHEGALPLHPAGPLEEFGVLRVRARPPALDERDAEVVEPSRDPELVLARQRDPLALRAVPQGGVVDLDHKGWEYTHTTVGSRRRRAPLAPLTSAAPRRPRSASPSAPPPGARPSGRRSRSRRRPPVQWTGTPP